MATMQAVTKEVETVEKGVKRVQSSVDDKNKTVDRPLRRRLSAVASPALSQTSEVAKQTLRDLKAIVISLDRRPDRMEGCAARLTDRWPALQFSAFSATDGRQTTIPDSEVTQSWHTGRNTEYQIARAKRKGWDDLDTYQVRTLPLSAGERGCSSSHIRAWRHCLEQAGDTDRPLLVLEDDAAPTEECVLNLSRALSALPTGAHILYLGYSQAAEWRREISTELVEMEYVWTTVGYIVWPAGARILLDRLPIDQPVDNWMATLCADRHLNSYCVRPKVIHQADAWNTNSDVAHSDEQYWGPCSDINHSDALYWGKEHDPEAKDGDRLPVNQSFWDIGSDDSEDSADEQFQ